MRLGFVLLLPALFAGPAFTASDALPQGSAGFGSGAVSGYTVSSISYSLEDETVDTVSFTLSPPVAATVRPASLRASRGRRAP